MRARDGNQKTGTNLTVVCEKEEEGKKICVPVLEPKGISKGEECNKERRRGTDTHTKAGHGLSLIV